MNAPTVRLAIVEDEHLYRDLLRTVLQLDPQLEVVGDYATAESALEQIPGLAPTVALLDIELGGRTNGVQLGLLLREKLPELGIVLLSNVRAPRLLASIPPSHVSGWSYLLKKSVRDASVLRRAIDGAAMGLVTLDPSLVAGR
ncbi:MAG: response regulator, partial [Chloroflexi bacterium]|nr:response regulator [Chloroflexota bacterium]